MILEVFKNLINSRKDVNILFEKDEKIKRLMGEYINMINQISLFLDGKTDVVKEHIISSIDKCIENLEFEKAQELIEKEYDHISEYCEKASKLLG